MRPCAEHRYSKSTHMPGQVYRLPVAPPSKGLRNAIKKHYLCKLTGSSAPQPSWGKNAKGCPFSQRSVKQTQPTRLPCHRAPFLSPAPGCTELPRRLPCAVALCVCIYACLSVLLQGPPLLLLFLLFPCSAELALQEARMLHGSQLQPAKAQWVRRGCDDCSKSLKFPMESGRKGGEARKVEMGKRKKSGEWHLLSCFLFPSLVLPPHCCWKWHPPLYGTAQKNGVGDKTAAPTASGTEQPKFGRGGCPCVRTALLSASLSGCRSEDRLLLERWRQRTQYVWAGSEPSGCC